MHVLSMPHMTLFILLTIQCHHYPHFRWRKQKFSGGNNLPIGTAVKGAAPDPNSARLFKDSYHSLGSYHVYSTYGCSTNSPKTN